MNENENERHIPNLLNDLSGSSDNVGTGVTNNTSHFHGVPTSSRETETNIKIGKQT